MPSTRVCLVASVLGLVLAPSSRTQVPPGYFVLGTSIQATTSSYPWTGPAGLFVGHPRAVGSMWIVNGLPASLTTRPPTWNGEYGVGGLAIHPWTGDLLVGDSPDGGGILNLYRIGITQLATTPVTFSTTMVGTYALGVATAIGGLVVNPGVRDVNRVIVGCANVASGPIGAGSMQIGELDLSTPGGVITPWPAISAMLPGPYSVRAICVEPGGANAYMTGSDNTTVPSEVWKVPLPATGAPTTMSQIASLPIVAMSMRWDPMQNKLVVGGRLNTVSQQSLWEVDPTGVMPPLPVGPVGSWNSPVFDIEPTTGDVLFAGVPSGGVPGVHHFVRGAATPTWLCNGMATGMVGLPFAFAVAPSPTPFGPASVSGTGPLVTWAAASTAGLPLVGNGTYSLRLDPGPGTIVTGLLAASVAPQIPPVAIPGLGILLNIALPFVGQMSFASPTILLGIPNVPALGGQDLYLQALTLTNFVGAGPVLGATEGAWLRVL